MTDTKINIVDMPDVIPNGVHQLIFENLDMHLDIAFYPDVERSNSSSVEGTLIQTVSMLWADLFEKRKDLDVQCNKLRHCSIICNSVESARVIAHDAPLIARWLTTLNFCNGIASECLRERKFYPMFYNAISMMKLLNLVRPTKISDHGIYIGKFFVCFLMNGITHLFTALKGYCRKEEITYHLNHVWANYILSYKVCHFAEGYTALIRSRRASIDYTRNDIIDIVNRCRTCGTVSEEHWRKIGIYCHIIHDQYYISVTYLDAYGLRVTKILDGFILVKGLLL